jgi:hypothetical protein
MDIAMKYIQDGASASDEAVIEKYFEAAADQKRIQARNADNVADVSGTEDVKSFDDTAAGDAFAKGIKGGKL